jgi:formylglycine-generating enzyme required for sulfatase activity
VYPLLEASGAAMCGSVPRIAGEGKLPETGETQEKRPVEQVSWYDAIAFCNKLSIRDGKTPAYTVTGIDWSTLDYNSIPTSDNATWSAAVINTNANGYRLPTQMEWMWAAMGATAGGADVLTAGYNKGYAGSMEGSGQANVGDYAWYTSNSGSKTHEVGKKLANELGLSDMSGNVFEWCWDWNADSYATGALTDPVGATSGSDRVVCGGSWATLTELAGGGFPMSVRVLYYGFRVVRSGE